MIELASACSDGLLKAFSSCVATGWAWNMRIVFLYSILVVG